jgi:hypothetical protein
MTSTILTFSSYFLQKEYLFIFFNPWNTFPLYFIIFPHKIELDLSMLSLSLEKSQEDLFSCSLFFIKCYWNKNYIIFILLHLVLRKNRLEPFLHHFHFLFVVMKCNLYSVLGEIVQLLRFKFSHLASLGGSS